MERERAQYEREERERLGLADRPDDGGAAEEGASEDDDDPTDEEAEVQEEPEATPDTP